MSGPYRWQTNLRAPFSGVDSAWLSKLETYKIGAPQLATGRKNPLSVEDLQERSIVGVYAPDSAMPPDVMGAFERTAHAATFQPLSGPLAKFLDENQHLQIPT